MHAADRKIFAVLGVQKILGNVIDIVQVHSYTPACNSPFGEGALERENARLRATEVERTAPIASLSTAVARGMASLIAR